MREKIAPSFALDMDVRSRSAWTRLPILFLAFFLSLSLSAATAPRFTKQPVAQSVAVKTSATFTVTATGVPAPTYQWQKVVSGAWSNLSGATTSSYKTPATTLADDQAQFRVVARNASGAITSNVARLTVYTPAAVRITKQPVAQSVVVGTAATFTVTATGVPAPTYQWQKMVSGAWSNLSGATASSYKTPVTTLADNQAQFRVVASNASGAITSNVVRLTVTSSQPPVATFTSSASVVDFAGQATLSWTVTGATSVSLDGVNVTGQTSTVVHPRNRQTYVLRAQNASGTTTKTLIVAARGLDVLSGVWDGCGYKDGSASKARFGAHCPIVRDSAGNFYIADQFAVRKIAPDGSVITLAGIPGWGGYQDGPFLNGARFGSISSMVLDEVAGRIYVGEMDNGAIRVLDLASGQVSTLVGGPSKSPLSYLQTQIDPPVDLALGPFLSGLIGQIALDQPHGLLYVPLAWTESFDQVMVVDLNLRTIGTYAGGTQNFSGNNLPRLQALITSPIGLTVDPQGNLYIASAWPWGNSKTMNKVDYTTGLVTSWNVTGNAIQELQWNPGTQGLIATRWDTSELDMLDPVTGASTLLAGGIAGTQDGTGASAQFLRVDMTASCLSGSTLYLMDSGRLRTLDLTTATVTSQQGASPQMGAVDGSSSESRINSVTCPILDSAGNLFFVDGSAIRKMAPDGSISTLAGAVKTTGYVDGPGAQARFGIYLNYMVRDAIGNLVVADSSTGNGLTVIRRIAPNGTVSTVAGSQTVAGFVNDVGAAARFVNIQGLALDAAGNLYVADAGTLWQTSTVWAAVRKIAVDGTVTILAGGQIPSSGVQPVDGWMSGAVFGSLQGLWTDPSGNLYTMDASHMAPGAAVRRIALDGTVTTIAGSLFARGSQDGTGSQALFQSNGWRAFHPDAQGNLFLLDSGTAAGTNNRIRKVTPAGVVTTISTLRATGESIALDVDGTTGPSGNSRSTDSVEDIISDPATGTVYVVEHWMNAIRKISPYGYFTSILRRGGNEPGSLGSTGVWFPSNLVVTPSGDLIYTTAGAIMQITNP